ncbi:choice-of-anchor Q domain-containing protein [Dysgonomonas sp. ZJ279]|uniref:choice-of-anchor Q domain-containing protein n=1 Tax=Dysgonomonas sp. ZJ279 TaxID=2709796 RepID=UPI002105213E|nr:choice-of-anchor Q domain-containing protein [Dysgonomonas sp. ZJ279]
MRKLLYIILITICCSYFWACDDNDNFSSDSKLKLEFSTNSVQFDTVFSSIGSTTRQFKIFNRNNNSLTIQSIELVNASVSGFRMNIDGQRGTSFSDVPILRNDSLFAFVEVTVNPKTNSQTIIRDSIRFVTNGNTQYVHLEAIGQDVYIWKGKIIATDTTLTNKKPFLIYDSLVVKEGVTLDVKEGTKFFFRRNASLIIHGTLNAQGTIEKPIILRGDRFDNIEGDISYNNVSGQWDGIYFSSNSYNNYLKNFHTRNATNGMIFLESQPTIKKASLINTVVQNNSENGVLAINCDIDAQNCLLVNSKGAALELNGGKYSFLHCTIANYYTWSPRQKEALIIKNTLGLSKALPLTQCDIINSIIYGSVSNEISLSGTNTVPFVYQFTNCLVKSPQTSNPQFVNTIWNEDPLFRNLNYEGNYVYDFQLKSSSPAIDKADKIFSIKAPFDLIGRSRLSDSNPDIGCYEWFAN